MEGLSAAEQVVFDYAEVIAEKIINKQNFTIPRDAYKESEKDEIIRDLLRIKEIENVIPGEDGLHVFIY